MIHLDTKQTAGQPATTQQQQRSMLHLVRMRSLAQNPKIRYTTPVRDITKFIITSPLGSVIINVLHPSQGWYIIYLDFASVGISCMFL